MKKKKKKKKMKKIVVCRLSVHRGVYSENNKRDEESESVQGRFDKQSLILSTSSIFAFSLAESQCCRLSKKECRKLGKTN